MDDAELVAALRAGDEGAFAELVRRYHVRMLRVAEVFVPSRAVAEEVVQETWLGVVRGIGGFEGRSTLKTWLFRILVNRARSLGAKEPRAEPLDDQPLERFDRAGGWIDPPRSWTDDADDRMSASQLAVRVRDCLPGLPEAQRQVVLLRDVEGLSAEAACSLLGLTEGNQRVLLHRARSRVRQCLDAGGGR